MDALKIAAAMAVNTDPPSAPTMHAAANSTDQMHDIQRRLEHVSTLYTSINGILAQADPLITRISEDAAVAGQHVTDAEAAVLRRYNVDMRRPAHWKPVIVCALAVFALAVILLST